MAGLLDIFGTGGVDTMGLLGMSQGDISRNREDAQAQALYALAGRLFQGGNTGQSIAEGLQLGQRAYKGGMQDTMQSQLQNFQLQELLRKRKEDEAKRQLEQQALMRQQGIESEIAKAYRPQTFAETPVTNLMGQEIAGPSQPQEAGLGLAALAPRLMATPEGRKALTELMASQKAMSGELTTLPEGANLVRVSPTGDVKTVASGAPKKEKPDIAGDVKEARQVLGIMTPVDEMTQTERALVRAYIDRKDAGKAPKVTVDLKDPTAVAMAGLKLQSDIRQDFKGPKDTATAYQTMYNAATNPTQKGDTTMLYTFFKVLDPQSTVREGEIEMIKQSRSIPEKFKGMAIKLASGQTLLESERADLLNQAYQYVSNQQRGVTETIDMYKDYAKSFGLNPDKAVPNPFADIKKPPSKTVMINKKSTVAKLADDGNYYIQSGTNTDGTPKYFKVD
jgi:hypothetical protein